MYEEVNVVRFLQRTVCTVTRFLGTVSRNFWNVGAQHGLHGVTSVTNVTFTNREMEVVNCHRTVQSMILIRKKVMILLKAGVHDRIIRPSLRN